MAEAGEPALERRIEFLSTKFIYKNLSCKNSIPIKYLLLLMDSIVSAGARDRAYRSFPIFEIFCRLWFSRKYIHRSIVPPHADTDFRAMSLHPAHEYGNVQIGGGERPPWKYRTHEKKRYI